MLECWPSLEEQTISLTVQALQEQLILGTCKQQLETFMSLGHLELAILKLSRLQVLSCTTKLLEHIYTGDRR